MVIDKVTIMCRNNDFFVKFSKQNTAKTLIKPEILLYSRDV